MTLIWMKPLAEAICRGLTRVSTFFARSYCEGDGHSGLPAFGNLGAQGLRVTPGSVP
jgi:hypothetical protein